jgi:hypothetical protein
MRALRPLSIATNLAEGHNRFANACPRNFLTIARLGSGMCPASGNRPAPGAHQRADIDRSERAAGGHRQNDQRLDQWARQARRLICGPMVPVAISAHIARATDALPKPTGETSSESPVVPSGNSCHGSNALSAVARCPPKNVLLAKIGSKTSPQCFPYSPLSPQPLARGIRYGVPGLREIRVHRQ